MPKGIKVVKPGNLITTTNPSNIVVDSRQSGAMKISQVIYQDISQSKWTETYTLSRMNLGRIRIDHTLGFPPPFIAYLWKPPIGGSFPSNASSELLPVLGFAVYMRAYTTATQIVIDGIEALSTTNRQGTYHVVIIVFAENLDATV